MLPLESMFHSGPRLPGELKLQHCGSPTPGVLVCGSKTLPQGVQVYAKAQAGAGSEREGAAQETAWSRGTNLDDFV